MLAVHLEGYLNVLDAALPLMAAAGHGHVLGVTSGLGVAGRRCRRLQLRQAGRRRPHLAAGPAGAAGRDRQRHVAHRRHPDGGRRPRAGPARRAGRAGAGSPSSRWPGPEDLGPLGAYLVGEEFGWCSGRVLFAGGSEVAVVDEPRLLEVVRTDEVVSLARVLEAVVPRAFAKAEASQASDGGGNPRFGPIFDEPAPAELASAAGAVLCRRHRPPRLAASLTAALEARSITCHRVDVGPRLRRRRRGAARRRRGRRADRRHRRRPAGGRPTAASAEGWERVLGRAPRDRRAHPHRRRMGPGGRRLRRRRRPPGPAGDPDRRHHHGRSQPGPGSAQLARVAAGATEGRVTAFAASIEASEEEAGQPAGELVAHLLGHPEAAALAGAELVVGAGWLGLRSHPRPIGSITYGGPAVPDWLDATLREIVGATGTRPPREAR